MDIMVRGGAAASTGEQGRCTGGLYWQGYVDSAMEAAALVDAAGRIVCTTAAFDRIAGDGDGVRIAGVIPHARLYSATAGEQMRLDAALARAIARTAPLPSATRCSRLSGRSPLIVIVRPIPWATRLLQGNDGAAVLSLVDPNDRPAPAPALWREAFNLTPCEAALAALLMAGHSVESAAATRNCRPATLRVHLRGIFAKTDVSRQSDLIALLARIGR